MLTLNFRDKKNSIAFEIGFPSPSRMTYTSSGGNNWIETTEAPIRYYSTAETVYGVRRIGRGQVLDVYGRR